MEGGERERQKPLTSLLSPRKLFKHLYGRKGLIFLFELCLITLSEHRSLSLSYSISPILIFHLVVHLILLLSLCSIDI